MEKKDKHVPDMEISTYGEGFFTYTGNSVSPSDALKNIHRNRTGQDNQAQKGGPNEQNNRTNK